MGQKAKPFHRQTPAEKRVTIAKDVLKWLRTGKLLASPGNYLDVWKSKTEARKSMAGDWDVKYEACVTDKAKVVNGYVCEACALGGIFAVAVEHNKRLNCGDTLSVGSGLMHERLAPYFPVKQLYAIENAFEMSSINPGPGWDMYTAKSPTVRMRAIMTNIIRNEGEFVLPSRCCTNPEFGDERELANQTAA